MEAQGTGALTEYIDVAQVSLYVFWIFFAWLIFYIRRTDRREGYPLESDNPRLISNGGGTAFVPPPKEYRLPHGEESYFAPPAERDEDDIAAERVASFKGAAYRPNGENPMLDRVGPASYARRRDIPDLTYDGHNLIQPMSKADGFQVAAEDKDPRGWELVGADDEVAGTITDIWVDVSDQEARFLEVDTGGSKSLVPMPLVTVYNSEQRCKIYAVLGSQIKDAPKTKVPDAITRLEDDMICAYFAGGRLYATKAREESLVTIPIYVGGDFKV